LTTYQLSPSALTFAWDGCKRCFYLNVKHGISYQGPFPGIFTRMGNLTSNFYLDQPARVISSSLPVGTVKFRELRVKSAPIDFAGTASKCFIKGRLDALIAFDNSTFGIIDYKPSDASEEQASFYSRQLSAYAYALENPAPLAAAYSPISRLGLFILTPARYENLPGGETAFVTRTTWVEIPRDDAAFLALLQEIVTLLDMPLPPPPGEDCSLCNYRREYRDAGILE